MHGGSAASCCARWPSSGQPAECRGIGLRNTRGPYAVSCREGSGSALPSRTYIPRARDGSCSISSTALYELTRDGNPSPPNETYELRCEAPSASMRLLAKQAIVVGMAANPEPDESIGRLDGQGSVVGADSNRPEATDFLEVQ